MARRLRRTALVFYVPILVLMLFSTWPRAVLISELGSNYDIKVVRSPWIDPLLFGSFHNPFAIAAFVLTLLSTVILIVTMKIERHTPLIVPIMTLAAAALGFHALMQEAPNDDVVLMLVGLVIAAGLTYASWLVEKAKLEESVEVAE
ncbi:hypothetical protein [Dermabacter vaginalis]|uniref:Uncharacterized protein n=1 Tax=Dermabacter vaginalis TaxID=1630135 RepID=A0ABX6A466_9MICO|nr:hypothetical protein [Dermabacter vaginalis]QEU11409.1 hypothetical protein FOB48_03250 [Dermabacter vaginalis]